MKVVGILFLFLLNFEAFASQVQRCGLRQGAFGKVVGGVKAKKNEWPWLVAFIKVPENTFFCGGSLISAQHILSGE